MPKGRGKEYQNSDEAVYDVPGSEKDIEGDIEDYEKDEELAERVEEPLGYEAGEEEREKMESIISRRQREPVPEPAPEPTKRFAAGEPIYLYIQTSLGTYQVVDRTFDSRVEASRFAEENYKGTPYKTMNEADIKKYMEGVPL